MYVMKCDGRMVPRVSLQLQHELDLLNRKFDQLMKQRAGQAEMDEDAGPLEVR